MHVELVNVTTADGIRLDGYLREPENGSGSSAFAFDAVICHHGVGSNFYVASFFDVMGDALVAHGCAVLRVNNRGHDQAYLSNGRRLGAAFEIIDDCRHDWNAWLDFARERGYERVALWGHSLGAVKTVYFLATQDDPRVTCGVASSPPRFVNATYASAENGERFRADIQRAQSLIAAGTPLQILEALVPQERPFSAQTYVDKYGPDARYDYLERLKAVRKPLLLTLGSKEAPDVSFAPLAQQGPVFADRFSGVDYRLIDGADHSYMDRTDALWAAVSSWLPRSGGSARQPSPAASAV